MNKFPSETRCSGGRHARMVVLAAAALSLVAAVPARADVTDQLLDQLKAKGILTSGEYAELRARHEAEKADMSRPAHMHRMVTKNGVVMVPDDRYLTRLNKGIGFHIPGLITKEGEIGAVDVKLTGELIIGGDETFKEYFSGNPATNGLIRGGLITASPNNSANAISNGLLPSAIGLNISTNQMGYDLGFMIEAYVGGNNIDVGSSPFNANSPGAPIALGTPGIDLRRVYGTVGTPTFGSVKMGRDLGLFGSDAILNDLTLLGFGSPLDTQAPRNTTLGRIGIGYVYADWIPQITYTTPDFNGFTGSIGAFTPLVAADVFTGSDPATGLPVSANVTGQELPMVQGQAKWKGAVVSDAMLTVSADGLWQEHRVDTGDGTFTDSVNLPVQSAIQSWGVDGFGKLDIDGFSFVATGYYGQGLGTTGFFFDAFDFNGNPRTTFGGYAQASYTWDRFTFGGSWGVSALSSTGFDVTQAYNPTLLKDNESAIGFVRYQLTAWMTLQTEFVHTWAINQSGGQQNEDDVWFGTAWFF
jgi:hypothetical protein